MISRKLSSTSSNVSERIRQWFTAFLLKHIHESMLSAPCVIKKKSLLLKVLQPLVSLPSSCLFFFFFSLNRLTVMKSDCQSDSGQFYYNANNSVKPHPLPLRWHTNQYQREADTCTHTCLHLCTKVRLLLKRVDGTHGCRLRKQTHRFRYKNRKERDTRTPHTHPSCSFLCSACSPSTKALHMLVMSPQTGGVSKEPTAESLTANPLR